MKKIASRFIATLQHTYSKTSGLSISSASLPKPVPHTMKMSGRCVVLDFNLKRGIGGARRYIISFFLLF